jgi:putative transposase
MIRSRASLAAENLVLRQQLSCFKQAQPRPKMESFDHCFWIALHRWWPSLKEGLIVVKPETIVGWHRKGFRYYWRRKSKKIGRPPISQEARELIKCMAKEGKGAPQIHAALLKLDIDGCERTVSRYLAKYGKKVPTTEQRQRYRTFLANHRDCLAGMDFCVVPTATFKLLYILVVIHQSRRKILHFNVTYHPTRQWVIQQLREAFPFDSAPEYLIYDNDTIFGGEVTTAIKNMGVKPTKIAYRCPWQNGVAERVIGTLWRELLNHIIIFNDLQLNRLLREYVDYYHEDRGHLALAKDTPNHRVIGKKPSREAQVIALSRVGGLHHRYEWCDEQRLAA